MFLPVTPPNSRSFAADADVYANGNGSSENHESAMKRPVPDAHITSPPQSVSIPNTASATNRPILSTSSPLFLQRTKPHVQAKRYEHQRRNRLRNRFVCIERRADQIFAIFGQQAQGCADH